MERFSHLLCADAGGGVEHYHAVGVRYGGPDACRHQLRALFRRGLAVQLAYAPAAHAGAVVAFQLRGEVWPDGADKRSVAVPAFPVSPVNHHAASEAANA